MIGYKTLAVPGPTNMPFEIRKAMDVALEDHRAPDFPEFTKPLLEDVKSIFRTTEGHVFLFPGSGTGGWEAAIGNCLSPADTVLTSSFGQFSGLWVEMCRRFRLNVLNYDLDWGEGVPPISTAAGVSRPTSTTRSRLFWPAITRRPPV